MQAAATVPARDQQQLPKSLLSPQFRWMCIPGCTEDGDITLCKPIKQLMFICNDNLSICNYNLSAGCNSCGNITGQKDVSGLCDLHNMSNMHHSFYAEIRQTLASKISMLPTKLDTGQLLD